MSLPTPYYQDDAATLYCADCRDVLPEIDKDSIDLVLTDPPYGISAVSPNGHTFATSNACMVRTYMPVYGDDGPFEPRPMLAFRRGILWGGNHYASKLPDASCWLVWDKRDGLGSNPLADCELAWTNLRGPARLMSHRWMGMVKDSERGERWHPTQKPLALMLWCLSLAPDAHTILDPYAGSGTTLVAAKRLGRKAIGIEIEERYCAIAVRRLAQEVLL